eukprot:Pgem_evm2s17484
MKPRTKDDLPSPVETKANNPKYWGSTLGLQMVSSTSGKLIHGNKIRGSKRYGGCQFTLTEVDSYSLSDIMQRGISDGVHWSNVEKNILKGMRSLKKAFKNVENENLSEVFQMVFRGENLELRKMNAPYNKTENWEQVLPPANVVKE